jgi:hypothetical protein
MNIPDHISESLDTISLKRILIRDLLDGSGMEKFGSEIRNKHPGSATIAHNGPAARLVTHF